MVCISKAKPNPKLKASNSNICQKKMPDYRRTQKIFEEQGLSRLFKKPLELFQIYRIKRADGTEWLKSRVRLIGLDKAGNEVEHSFVDPEMFYKPLARHELKKKEPQNESSPLERVCVEAGLNPHNYQYTEHTLPFNQENFDKLYEQTPLKSAFSVTLVIYAEASSEAPRAITNVEHFTKRPFDDLWLEAITPKYKLDRSYRDTLEESHIK